MNGQQTPLSPTGLAAAVAMGIIGALIVWIVPGLLGVLSELAPLTDPQLGYVAAFEINAMAVFMGACSLLLGRVHWRLLLVLGLGAIALGNCATALSDTFGEIVAARVLAGSGEGLVTGVAFATLARWRNPDRAFALYLALGTSFTAALLWMFPSLQLMLGASRLLLALAALPVLAVVAVRYIPDGRVGARGSASAMESATIHWKVAIPSLIGVFFYFLAMGAVWSYFERIGSVQGLETGEIARALALSNLSGILGAGLAGLLPRRIGRVLPLVVSGIASLASFYLLDRPASGAILLAAGVVFTVAWNFAQPLVSGICAEADRAGRIASGMGCVQTIGYGLGPALTAVLIGSGVPDFRPALWAGSVVLVLGLILVMQSQVRAQRGRGA